MINLKWSGIAGGFGFAVSLLVGIISGAGFPLLLVRAFIFGLLFFILGGGAWLLINNFVPELLFPGENEGDSAGGDQSPGAQVDISLGDEPVSALPENYQNSESGDEVGNITDLLTGKTVPENQTGMDQNGEDGYTKTRGSDFQTEAAGSYTGPAETAAAGVYADSAGGLPDLDSMAGAFAPSPAEPVESPADFSPPVRSPSGNKPQSLKGDFNPKDLAAAIRTKISKE
ncbi:MAG: hypothetical protein LBD78_04135 [Spirochaetaceae bacterium]|nr:hypothetical protein [Spirochaetaceae bacterium]